LSRLHSICLVNQCSGRCSQEIDQRLNRAAAAQRLLENRRCTPSPGLADRLSGGFSRTASAFTAETDWLLEGNGFEVPVPHEIGSGFEASAELWSIDRQRGGIIRAVVGLGKQIELLRCIEESSFTAA
jgi:hypothetical protein